MIEQERRYEAQPEGWSPPLVRWNAVFAGTVIALAAGAVAGTLWLALAYGSHRHLFYQHLDWWIGGTAIFAMFLAGLPAEASSGTRGIMAGLVTGMTTWGLVVLGILAIAIPGVLATSNTTVLHLGARSITVSTLRWWSSFWSLLIGLGAAAAGGLIGGAMPRSRTVPSHRAVARRVPNGRVDGQPTDREESSAPLGAPASLS
jgi:uncharacterized integral membrane protein